MTKWECRACHGRCTCTQKHVTCYASRTGYHHSQPLDDRHMTFDHRGGSVRIKGLNA